MVNMLCTCACLTKNCFGRISIFYYQSHSCFDVFLYRFHWYRWYLYIQLCLSIYILFYTYIIIYSCRGGTYLNYDGYYFRFSIVNCIYIFMRRAKRDTIDFVLCLKVILHIVIYTQNIFYIVMCTCFYLPR
jgi:hypothetical protein